MRVHVLRDRRQATGRRRLRRPCLGGTLEKLYYRILVCALLVAANRAAGCDLCGCYTPQIEAMPQSADEPALGQPSPTGGRSAGWLSNAYFAVAEQYTYFGTLRFEGDEVPNPTDQHEDSSITELVAGYSFTPRFALQINVPLIYRSVRRPEGFTIDRGTESGVGDVSLLAKFVLFHTEQGGGRRVFFDDPKNPRLETREPDFTASAILIGGVKFPTGDASRLEEEFNEV